MGGCRSIIVHADLRRIVSGAVVIVGGSIVRTSPLACGEQFLRAFGLVFLPGIIRHCHAQAIDPVLQFLYLLDGAAVCI